MTGGREWPGDLLDVAALRARGVPRVPFRVFVVKIHGRCNLACDYCYVYEMADQSWRDRPVRMTGEVLAATADRIGEHARTHRLDRVRVVLHGGEPLLAGPAALAGFARLVRAALPAPTRLEISVQTNGVLLDEEMLGTLVAHGVRIGVSLDGDRAATDRHRGYADGRSSHRAVARALELLGRPPYRSGYAGILVTVDPRGDPLAVYEHVLAYRPPRVDFRLPHGTWSSPPPGISATGVPPGGPAPRSPAARRPVPYGEWLARIFDRWYATVPVPTDVRLFTEIIQLLLGGRSPVESLGLTPVDLVVVETDGSIRQLDALTAAYSGAADTGLTVAANAFDDALDHPGVVARQLGRDGLAGACRACELVEICGGGSYPHRYLAGSGFAHPSVYCADLYHLITHIRDRVAADLARLRGRPARRSRPGVGGTGPGAAGPGAAGPGTVGTGTVGTGRPPAAGPAPEGDRPWTPRSCGPASPR